jgi:HK97 family phage major capsid protein
MNLDEMNLQQVEERLAALDVEVREATEAEAVEKAAEEKKGLLARKAELVDLEQRKKTALDLTAGAKTPDRVIDIRKDENNMKFSEMTLEQRIATPEYRDLWLAKLMGRNIEKRANEMGITEVGAVVPTITQERIFNKLRDYVPLLNEITLLQVPGNVSFVVEGVKNEAALHAENTLITPAADTMVKVTLAGYEIVKVLRISATIQAMSINSFEGWLAENLAEGIAEKIGALIIYGDGDSKPTGINKAATWADGTNAVDWATDNTVTTAELIELVGYLKPGYHRRAKFLMNHKTYWNIVSKQEDQKFKIMTPDWKRLLGYEILLDDRVNDFNIFFGDFKKVVGNLAQNVEVKRSEASGFLNNAVDFRGTAIFDCKVAVGEAFVKAGNTL